MFVCGVYTKGVRARVNETANKLTEFYRHKERVDKEKVSVESLEKDGWNRERDLQAVGRRQCCGELNGGSGGDLKVGWEREKK